jgi:peptidyl-prolyl cis-trans isomerase SurA
MWDDRLTEAKVLEDMVENKLIVQKARELNIKIDERRISSAVDSRITQIKSQFPSEEVFFKELRATGLLLSDLRKYYEEMTTEQFLKDRLMQTEIRSKVVITDADLLAFYNEEKMEFPLKDESYELAMILRIPGPSPETDRKAKDKINSLKNRLNNGEDFGQLAKEFSECPSAAVMGDLGYFSRGMMVKEFEDVAFNLQLNQVSDVVKTQFGYHLIKLTNKRSNEIQASHILVLLAETDDDVSREKAFMQDLLTKLKRGESFAKLATEYSQDPDSQKNNGIIGTLTKKEFPQFFDDALIYLQPGQITDVLEYQNMLYLFTINKVVEPRPFEFQEIQDYLKEILTNKKQLELYEQWVENLKKEIFVQIYETRL